MFFKCELCLQKLNEDKGSRTFPHSAWGKTRCCIPCYDFIRAAFREDVKEKEVCNKTPWNKMQDTIDTS